MIRQLYISPLNGIRWVKAGQTTAAKYNNPIENEAWFTELRKSWEDYADYTLKKQTNDSLFIRAWANEVTESSPTLELYSCDGEVVITTAMIAENLTLIDPYDTDISYANPNFWNAVDPGRYYLYMTVPYDDGVNVFWISEPIEVAERWEDTILIEYRHSTNKMGVLFENRNFFFSFRIEGIVYNPDDLINRVVFSDQNDDTDPLYANAYEGYALLFGGGNGGFVPDYATKIGNNIFTCDQVLIEGTQYTAADGAQFEKTRTDGYRLVQAVIQLRFPDNDRPNSWSEGGLDIFEKPAAYPFIIMSFSINNGTFPGYIYATPTLILDDDDLANYIAARNVNILAAGLTGTIEQQGDFIVYVVGMGENYNNCNSKLLTKYMTLRSITIGSSNNLNFVLALTANLAGGQSAYGFVNPSNTLQQVGYISGITPLPLLSAYIAGAAGTYDSLLFHDDTLSLIQVKGDYLRDIIGPSPANLIGFNVSGNPRLTTFNILGALSASKNSLTNLIVQNNATLTTITNYYNSITDYMVVLRSLLLQGNNMGTSGANALYNNIYEAYSPGGVFFIFNGQIDTSAQLSGQSASNVGVGNSATARSVLINQFNWEVII